MLRKLSALGVFHMGSIRKTSLLKKVLNDTATVTLCEKYEYLAPKFSNHIYKKSLTLLKEIMTIKYNLLLENL